LDLCLEYFVTNKNLTLHICGPMEDDFLGTFKTYLKKENIIYHGFVDVQSKKFIDIVSQCSFSILPTCSEGQSTALLTTMGAGLIPIATKYSGVDIKKYGILIDELDLEALNTSMIKAIKLDEERILQLSIQAQNYVFENHTLDKFETNIKNIIKIILND